MTKTQTLSAFVAITCLALGLARCADDTLPFYYTPTNDPRCATFEASAKPANREYCRKLTIKILHQRYPGWKNLPDK